MPAQSSGAPASLRALRAIPLALTLTVLCHAPRSAHAHGIAGVRIFPTTLTIDDPAVADEASLPTITYLRNAANGDPGPTHQWTIVGEFDKRITERLGIAINAGYTVLDTAHDKTRTGFQDLVVTLKYQAYVNPEHELLVSVGVIREFGRTGTEHIGADRFGNTTPTIYAGKGLGDLPIGVFRPLAVTGTFGYAIADVKQKLSATTDADTGLVTQIPNAGYGNRALAGLSVQYSVPYLQQQVRDYGLPDWLARLTPLVELSVSSPVGRQTGTPTLFQIAPGVIYSGDVYQVGVELLIPGNKASGTNVGAVAQLHLFFDDIFPTTLGRPLFQ